MLRARRYPKPCPACGHPLRRRRREPGERGLKDAASGRSLYRYACTSGACGWHGLLPRRSRAARHGIAPAAGLALSPSVSQAAPPPEVAAAARWKRQMRLPWAQVGGVLLTASMLALAGAQLVRHVLNAPTSVTEVAVGESFDGETLPERHPWAQPVALERTAEASPSALEPLDMRRGCAWGKPGRNPYRGSVEQALTHARLSAEVVREVALRVQHHQVTDRVVIRTGQIRAEHSGAEYDPEHFAMSFGRSMCLNSRVNFAKGHEERADLYEVTDNSGRRHAVMVPDVCGNVSVLGARGERRRLTALAAGAADEGERWAVLATGAFPEDPTAMPLPGSLALVAVALAAAAAARRRPGFGTPRPPR